MAERDRYLDYLRGLAIFWVVLVHVFYLKDFVPEGSIGATFKSLMLFEMPLLFFVSGASLYYSYRRNALIRRYLADRTRRLLIPYVFLGTIAAVLFYLKQLEAGRPLHPEQVVSWLLLRPWPVVPEYVGGYLWFMRVMIAVSLLHIVLVRLFSSERLRTPVAMVLIIGIVAFTGIEDPYASSSVSLEQLPQYTVFYGAFAYLGYYYASGRLFLGPLRLILAMIASAALLFSLMEMGIVWKDNQLNKFPPNIGYGLLGISWLSFLLLIRPIILAAGNTFSLVGRGLRFFGERSYTVFLYHGFGFWVADFFLELAPILTLWPGRVHYSVWILVYFALALLFTSLITVVVDGVLARIKLVPDRLPIGKILAWAGL